MIFLKNHIRIPLIARMALQDSIQVLE
jgi:hypothetical protein